MRRAWSGLQLGVMLLVGGLIWLVGLMAFEALPLGGGDPADMQADYAEQQFDQRPTGADLTRAAWEDDARDDYDEMKRQEAAGYATERAEWFATTAAEDDASSTHYARQEAAWRAARRATRQAARQTPDCDPSYGWTPGGCVPSNRDHDCPELHAMGLGDVPVIGADRQRLDGYREFETGDWVVPPDGLGCEWAGE